MAQDEIDSIHEARSAMLRRFRQVSLLSYEDTELLSEWLNEPVPDNDAQYRVNRSCIEILERLQSDGLRGQIYLVQTLRTFVTAQRDYQRLFEEAQTKLAQIRAIVGSHVNNPSGDDDRTETLGVALEILNVLDRPDDPWDVDDDTEYI